ncbi:MFS transporter [Escherichia coli]
MVAGRGGGSHYLCAENKLFRRCSARDMLLISAICGVVRWGIMGATTVLPWLIVVQILHCGTFTVCHLAAMLYCCSPG